MKWYLLGRNNHDKWFNYLDEKDTFIGIILSLIYAVIFEGFDEYNIRKTEIEE